MGVYKKSVITEMGEALAARAVSGEATIQFSHAKTSSYTYPEGTNLKKLTDLQEVKQTVIPSNVQIANDTLISIRSMFDNSRITQEYLIQNVGIYASDGETEILFAICQAATPDQMPAFNGVAPSSFIYNVQVSIAQAEQLSISINTAGAATVQDVIDLEKKVETKKLDSAGGDISNTIVKSFGTCEEEFPVPEPGEDSKALWGKVKKFAGDMKDWMTGVCLLGHIVNNCVTDRADLPLSAAQGKVLMDLYTVLNTNLNNKLIPQNVYDVKNGTFKNFDEITSTQIAAVYILNDGSDKTPSGRDGILVAFFVSQREWGMQIFADHYPNFYMRICWGGWKEWKKITAN